MPGPRWAESDVRYDGLPAYLTASRQPVNGASTQRLLAVEPTASDGTGLTLLAGRDLYTDRLSAARGAEDADLLHRADKIQLNPADAASLGIEDGTEVSVSGNGATLRIPAELSRDVPAGAAWLPILSAQGAAQRLSAAGAARPRVTVRSA